MQEFVLFVLGDALGWPPQFWIASADVFSLFGPLVCKNLSCLFGVICVVRFYVQSERLCLGQVGGAKHGGRQAQV